LPSSGHDIAQSGAVVVGAGLQWPPQPAKGPCRWKALRIITRRRLSRAGVQGGLGCFTHSPTRVPRPKAEDTATMQLQRRRERRRVDEGQRQECQRLDRVSVVGPIRPRSWLHRKARTTRLRAERRSAEAILDVVKTSGSLVMPYGAQDSVGRPRRESGESEPGTREVRVHVIRLGGRHRLDASRVFHTVRSQDRVVRKGASREEVRSSA